MSVVRAVLTGATGYLGGMLTRDLLARGWDLAAVVIPGDPAELPAGVIRLEDPGTAVELGPALATFAPEVIVHLAAVQDLRGGSSSSDSLVTANVGFGARMLAAAESAGARAFVAASSYSVHADGTSSYAPQTLYAATKAAFSTLSEHYRRNTNLAVVHLELSDTYGPGDLRPKFLNLLARAAATGVELNASPGEQLVRPIHVNDVSSAFTHAATLLTEGRDLPREVGVAGPDEVTLRQLTRVFEVATGVAPPVRWGALPYRPGEIMRPWNGAGLPGWRPSTGLREGLADVYGDLTPWKGIS